MGCCTPIVAYPTAPNKLQCVGLEWYESMFTDENDAYNQVTKSYTVERSGLYKLAIAATGADVNNAELGEKGTAFAVAYLHEGDKVYFSLSYEVAGFAIRGNWIDTRVADTDFDTLTPRKEAAFVMQLLTTRSSVPVGLVFNEVSTPEMGYSSSEIAGIRDERVRKFTECLCCFEDGTDMSRSGVAKVVELRRTRGVGNANAIKANEFYAFTPINIPTEGLYKIYATGGNQVKIFINGTPVLWKTEVSDECSSKRAFAQVRLPAGENLLCFAMDSRQPITASNMIDTVAIRIVDADAEVNSPMAEGIIPEVGDKYRIATALKGCATFKQGQFEKEITSTTNKRVEERVSSDDAYDRKRYFVLPKNDGTEHFIFGNSEVIEIDPITKVQVHQQLHVLGQEVMSPAAASGNVHKYPSFDYSGIIRL